MSTINWHPWRANPLDYIDAKLELPDGTPVTLTREGMDFVIRVDGKEISRTMDNSNTCTVLYRYKVGAA